ncbi:MAG: hypothetical protein JNK38_14515 [Acidobacteria bacterium]|nr:hypothetical protein [Acidobacteriota bacterium]
MKKTDKIAPETPSLPENTVRVLIHGSNEIRHAVLFPSNIIPDSEEQVVIISRTTKDVWIGNVAPYSSDQIVLTNQTRGKTIRSLFSLDECQIARWCDPPVQACKVGKVRAKPRRQKRERLTDALTPASPL